jgi:hypothetical protein
MTGATAQNIFMQKRDNHRMLAARMARISPSRNSSHSLLP